MTKKQNTELRLKNTVMKPGDLGFTTLGSGEKVKKASVRMHAVGNVEEAYNALSLVRVHADCKDSEILYNLQNSLMLIAAELMNPDKNALLTIEDLKFVETQIAWLTTSIEDDFILPHDELSARIEQARSVSRSAERWVWAVSDAAGNLNPYSLIFMNRLSDYLRAYSTTVSSVGEYWKKTGTSH